MSVTNPTATQAWSSYLDFAEVWPYLQMDGPPVGQDAIRLQRFIDSACATAQRAANRPFAPTQFQERHDGWSGDTIQLRYSPFLALVSCVENMSSGGSIALPEATPGNDSFDGVTIDYATARIVRTFAGGWPRPYFPGLRNIAVIYIAGFNPLPPDVWDATIDLVAYKWRMTQETTRWFPGAGAEYGGPATNALYPGVPNRIAEVFEAYRLPSIG
jgi:hypothetical protein